jgi:hypothetical protein
MRRSILLGIAALLLPGCGELLDEEAAAPQTPAAHRAEYVQAAPLPDDDDLAFPAAHAYAQATSPPPSRPRSKSLGFIGDAPLAGGVMRDTPMPPSRHHHPRRTATPLWALP